MVVLGLYLERFAAFVRTEEGKRWLEEAEAKKTRFRDVLSEKALDSLTEESLKNLFENLDAVPLREGAALLSRVLATYGLESVKEHLRYFLFGADPLEERFDAVRRGVPDLPAEVLMELVTFAAPRDFCIWDEDARQTVLFIGQSRMHGLSERAFSKELQGIDYVACKVALNHVREQVRAYLVRRVDFVEVQLFARYMSRRVMPAALGRAAAA